MDTLTILYIISVLALICAVVLAFSGVRCGGRTIPEPPEHLRPKGSVLRMRNPPKPPRKCVGITPHGRIYKDDYDFPDIPGSEPSP